MRGRDGDHVYEDDPGPAPGSTPPCPICPADKPHRVRPTSDVPDSYFCEGCGCVLTPHIGGDNARRRELWAEEHKKRSA